ncbi:pyridoxal phosphate-dependent aminotransferase [Peptoanaerobacter stomatis]|uniref:Aminotransferase class I/classII large domain-containing protein n=1 Tax=Peptoanaerobacter stomatis TaxID=796937 RepID=G9XDM0_9FIRM|nr:histidinol-phosphate transaminase [Peptoanaerobacter stomatis]EHL18950.1 hypothetical protein HMPREF9628_01893 [Peptoanaerobacter stomatis]
MKSKHGANLFELAQKLGCNIEEFRDFSSNINPFGTSKKAIEKLSHNLDKVSIYPDPEYKDLKDSISNYCKCKTENILLGSGASSFINSFIKILSPKNSLVLSPAYSEYEKELLKINSNISKYFLKSENNFQINLDEFIDFINKNEINTAIICNPNNPTGTILTNTQIKQILQSTNCSLIIDETYIEFTDTDIYSCDSLCDFYDKLFVIRGTSKFFASPGIRLGYAITSNRNVIESFEKYYNILWDINIFADIMGQEMFEDVDFQKDTFDRITKQRNFIFEELSKIDFFKPYKTYGNFILVEIKDKDTKASNLYDYLLQNKIIIRDCSSFDGLNDRYFRVCILKEDDNEDLIKQIKNFINGRI